jgi:hypothetical protein
MNRWEWGGMGLFAVLAVLGAGLVPVNHDEGWILLAGQAWQEGRLPGRDFVFPQGPWLAAVYSLGQGTPGEALIQGRRASVVLALGMGIFGVLAARRLHRPGVLVLLLLLLNPLVLGHLVLVKGFVPGAFLLSVSLWCLAGQNRGGQFFGAAVLALGTTGVRLSLGGPLVALLLWRRQGGWLWIGAVVGACLGCLPWWGLNPAVVLGQIWGVHMGPYGEGGLVQILGGKTLLLGRMVLFVAPVAVLGAMARPWAKGPGEAGQPEGVPLLPMLGAGLLAHLVPGTEHGEYVVLLWPLVALVGAGWFGAVSGPRQRAWWAVVGVHLLWGGHSLGIQRTAPAPGEGCRVLGREVARAMGPQQFLLGFEPLVAAEARRRVLPGMEMGAFSLARNGGTMRMTPGEVVVQVGTPAVGAVLLGERMFFHDGWNRGFSQGQAERWRADLKKQGEIRFGKQIQQVDVGQFKERMTLYVPGDCP